MPPAVMELTIIGSVGPARSGRQRPKISPEREKV
jgi:hypothetical protein